MLDGVQWKLLIGLHSWMTFCFVKGIKALLFCLFAEMSQSQCGMHTKHPPLPSHREIMARLQCRHCGQSGSYSRVPITSVAAVVAHTFTCSQSSSPFSSSSSSSFPQWHCLCARDADLQHQLSIVFQLSLLPPLLYSFPFYFPAFQLCLWSFSDHQCLLMLLLLVLVLLLSTNGVSVARGRSLRFQSTLFQKALDLFCLFCHFHFFSFWHLQCGNLTFRNSIKKEAHLKS